MEREGADFLCALRGRRSQVAWARRLGYPITNWERGKRFPTVAEALRAASHAAPDVREAFVALAPSIPLAEPLDSHAIASWVAAFVPIEKVPGLAERHAKSAAAKRIAFDAPWSEAVLRLLETTRLLELERHDVMSVSAGIWNGFERSCARPSARSARS